MTEVGPGPRPGGGGGAMELVAELKGRDGQRRTVRVPCPVVEGEAAQLRSVRQGLVELQQRVVELLAPLVQEEREAAAAAGGKRGEWREGRPTTAGAGMLRGGSAGLGAPSAPRSAHLTFRFEPWQALSKMTTTTTTRMKAKTKTISTRMRAQMILLQRGLRFSSLDGGVSDGVWA